VKKRDSNVQLVGGLHSVEAVVRHGPERILEAWVDRRRNDRRLNVLMEDLRAIGVPAQEAERQTLDRLAGGTNHQGIVVRARPPIGLGEADLWRRLGELDHEPLILVLDGVQDPHNLGACLRTADAAGVDAVIAPRDRSVGLTPVAVKVASGAAETVPFVQVTNLSRTLARLAADFRIWIVGTTGEAQMDLYQSDLVGPLAIIMGAEGEGMRRLTRERCDQLVSIPMRGDVESLNVSVATGVMLFEARRQRAANHP